jgi:hypothetical protein
VTNATRSAKLALIMVMNQNTLLTKKRGGKDKKKTGKKDWKKTGS